MHHFQPTRADPGLNRINRRTVSEAHSSERSTLWIVSMEGVNAPSRNFLLFKAALAKYQESIQRKPSEAIRKMFQRSDLLQEIKDVQARQSELAEQWLSDHAGWRKLAPLLDCLERFTATVDTFVQFNPSPASLIWGGIKLLLRVSRSPHPSLISINLMSNLGLQRLQILCNSVSQHAGEHWLRAAAAMWIYESLPAREETP